MHRMRFRSLSQLLLDSGTRWILLALLVCSMVVGCQVRSPFSSSASSGVIVRSAYGALGELFQTEIVNLALEELGYEVIEGLEIEYEVLHEAIARGYLEYSASHWNTLHTDFFNEFNQGQNRLVRAGTLLDSARQGYLIDIPTAEALNIDNLDQLRDPQIARQFDTDGNGKANLIGCDQGWGCHDIIEHHLDAYGLRDTVEHTFGEYDDLIKNTVMPRLQQGQPVLYYTWTPYWVSGALQPGIETQWLAVPFTDLPGNTDITDADTTVDNRNLGFAVDQIQLLANQDFLSDHPDVAALFQAMRLSVRDISLQNQRMVEQQETGLSEIRQHAEEWVANNRQQFEGWLEAARQAR